MTTDEIRTFVDRYIAAWEQQDVPTLVECYTDTAHVNSPMFRAIDGRARIEASFRDLFSAFDEWEIELEDIIIDRGPDDRAVFVYSAQVTHHGTIFGMPGTGRRLETSGAFILRFENGRIASERRVYDSTGFLVQLGVLKARAV
jgi:steroid delta-isomerase-like uncharacterized protein